MLDKQKNFKKRKKVAGDIGKILIRKNNYVEKYRVVRTTYVFSAFSPFLVVLYLVVLIPIGCVSFISFAATRKRRLFFVMLVESPK